VERVRSRQADLDAANAVLLVIAAKPLEELVKVAREEKWDGPVLADPERRVYLAFGLSRLPWYRVFTPKATLLYLGLILRDRFPGKPGQDVMQQGGDFIVDRDGIVRFASATRRSHDRPPVDDLINVLRRVS
jgi:peroxiredoxin